MGAVFDPLAEFQARTKKSAAWFDEAGKHIPGGVSSTVKFYPPYPVYATRAKGSRLWDLDGNEYIDYMLCFGPLILGHGHPKVMKAVRDTLDAIGTPIFGAPHEIEARMAERLNRIFPAAEGTRFCNSGMEATLHALRIARGFQRRNRIAKFEGHYHGTYDEALVSLTPSLELAGPDGAPRAVPGSLGTSEYTLKSIQVLPFNDAEDTVRILKTHRRDLAAVIMEPVQRGFIASDPEFLKTVREATEELGIILIFDEVMSGFRMDRLGGAQTMLGVTPDLMCLGKIIGGGFPCGAILGRADIMDIVNPVTRPREERVFHGGTFNGHPVVLAAGMATLDVLEEPGTYPYLNRITTMFQDGLNALFESYGAGAQAIGPGSTFNVVFRRRPIRSYRDAQKADAKQRQLFDFGLLARGAHLVPNKPFYTSTAHAEADIRSTLDAAEDVLRRMKAAGQLT